jgi:hypothetical protein
MKEDNATPKRPFFSIHYETTGFEYNRPYHADYVAVREALLHSSAVWILIMCLDWEKLLGKFNYPSTELNWIFDSLATLGGAISEHALGRLDGLSDLIDEGSALPEKIKAIINQTQIEAGDKQTLKDDEAIGRIRDLILEMDWRKEVGDE